MPASAKRMRGEIFKASRASPPVNLDDRAKVQGWVKPGSAANQSESFGRAERQHMDVLAGLSRHGRLTTSI